MAGDIPELEDRLGWLDISEKMLDQVDSLTAFAEEVRADGYTDVVLCGMGGSSLAPEVFRRSWPDQRMTLHVLDSTHPDVVQATLDAIDLDKTLFVVSSKSGGTVETMSQFKLFHERQGDGAHYVAVTDPGTSLSQLGRENGFRRVFENDPEIGGRYSALSYFGLVPAVLIGVDIAAVLESAELAVANCQLKEDNAGLWLGIALGELARNGRDKLTFVVDEPLSAFGLWAEQLVAESTGKQGRGILPIADEPLVDAGAYGQDRVFLHIAADDEGNAAAMAGLRKGGHPTITLRAETPADLGWIFFQSEFATAVAGWVLEINPFDQPNVQEAKDNTNRALREGPGELDSGSLDELLSGLEPPSYLAILAYLPYSEETDAGAARLRERLITEHGVATTFGYGPRYLHSTGQFHKGGPPVGRFVEIVDEAQADLPVPGEPYTFGTLIRAQADGDLQTLRAHGLPRRARREGDPLMQLGFIGLGKMGGNMVHRIHRDSDHQVVAFDFSADAVGAAEGHGATGASGLEDLVSKLDPPRTVWVMVPAGDATEQTVNALADLLDEGDTIVDGGNTNWHDDVRRAAALHERGIHYVDVGTSGGVWGLEVGYCMMVGGHEESVQRLAPILDVLAPPDGWRRFGDAGAGHFVKMVHNGVEYGIMQAYGEGFELMYKSKFDIDLKEVAGLWNRGSVVRSWLCELAERAFEQEGNDLADLGAGRV